MRSADPRMEVEVAARAAARVAYEKALGDLRLARECVQRFACLSSRERAATFAETAERLERLATHAHHAPDPGVQALLAELELCRARLQRLHREAQR